MSSQKKSRFLKLEEPRFCEHAMSALSVHVRQLRHDHGLNEEIPEDFRLVQNEKGALDSPKSEMLVGCDALHLSC